MRPTLADAAPAPGDAVARAAAATAAATAGATRGSNATGHDQRRALSSSATTAASASAAASFMPSVIARGPHVERAAEDAGEGQHVVDLVREVAAPGGDHRGVAGAPRRGAISGSGLARAKTIASRRHRGDRRLGHRAAGHADEDVGAGQRVGQRAGQAGRVGRPPRARRLTAVRSARPGVHDAPAVARRRRRRCRPRCRIRVTATPAAPAPETTARRSAERRARSAGPRCAARPAPRSRCRAGRRGRPGCPAAPGAAARPRSSAARRCPPG